jgi:hypothetical protein
VVLPGGEHLGGSFLATIRTGILAIATLVLAFAARYAPAHEQAWLVYPLLFLTGVKLVVIDFPQGHSQTLFAALALYGIALSTAPRMLRRAVVHPGASRSMRTEAAHRAASPDALAVGRKHRI